MKTKRPRDINQLAAFLVDEATSEDKIEIKEQSQKNQAAVELGRLGGLKGGKARADKLTSLQRKEIAQIAAKARWKKSADP